MIRRRLKTGVVAAALTAISCGPGLDSPDALETHEQAVSTPVVVFAPLSGPGGTPIRVMGSNYPAGEEFSVIVDPERDWTVNWNSPYSPVRGFKVRNDGTFSVTVSAPDYAAGRNVEVVLFGRGSPVPTQFNATRQFLFTP